MSISIFLIILIVINICVVGFLLYKLLTITKNKNEVDKSQNDIIHDLERRITDLLSMQLNEVRGSLDFNNKNIHEQVNNFTKETTEVKDFLKQVNERIKDMSNFQDLFKTPKLRGQWGEAQLYHLLSQYYPKDLWQEQYLFSTGNQVDAIFKLPDGQILPIDAKFPSENFIKMMETENENDKKEYQKIFVSDVKKKIDEIATKYILPNENTVDYALMYIPAEAIYYELINTIDKEYNIMEYAWSKKIVITSPNTLFLTLRIIEHWFKDTKLSEETHLILKKLNVIIKDATKLSDNFRKLGNHISNAKSAYEETEDRMNKMTTRVAKLIDFKSGDNDVEELNLSNNSSDSDSDI